MTHMLDRNRTSRLAQSTGAVLTLAGSDKRVCREKVVVHRGSNPPGNLQPVGLSSTPTKGPATDRPHLTHRATSRLHHLDSKTEPLTEARVRLSKFVPHRRVERLLWRGFTWQSDGDQKEKSTKTG